jgi:hypothetical protein
MTLALHPTQAPYNIFQDAMTHTLLDNKLSL